MNANVNPKTPYLTLEQVAERFNVSTASIWRWKREGRFPAAVRLGPSTTRWRLSDIIAHENSLEACLAIDFDFLSGK